MSSSGMRRALCRAVLTASLLVPRLDSEARERLVFGTNWKAEAEHGGFYQALAEGRYARYGLDIEIRPGGPMVNILHLLAAGLLDAAMLSNNAQSVNLHLRRVPVVTVAAFFQREPQALLTHPGSPHASIADMKGAPILISMDTRETWWRYFKLKFGFSDTQIRPYTFQMAPFLADKDAIVQGYITSEPFMLRHEGVDPRIFPIADTGWPSYSTLIAVPRRLSDGKPDVVQAFIDASIEGWYSYLYGDPRPANRLIRADNPEMTEELIAYGIAAMKAHGIVDSGDALARGIGAMTWERLDSFFEVMAADGVYPEALDHRAAYDLRFVNKGHGLTMRR